MATRKKSLVFPAGPLPPMHRRTPKGMVKVTSTNSYAEYIQGSELLIKALRSHIGPRSPLACLQTPEHSVLEIDKILDMLHMAKCCLRTPTGVVKTVDYISQEGVTVDARR